MRPRSHAAGRGGFTLIELAVVIAIVGLLLGALLVPLSTQIQIRKNQETQRRLDEAKDALIGFALANGRLPCPDNIDTIVEADPVVNGLEDLNPDPPPPFCRTPSTAGGTTLFGILPWQTLGLLPSDDWGSLLYYAVTEEFTYQTVPGGSPQLLQLDLDDNGEIRVQTRDDAGDAIDLTTTAPAVVLSVGANGYGGRTLAGGVNADPPTAGSADERNNYQDGDGDFMTRSLLTSESAMCDDLDPGQPLCPFDDLVVWLSTSVLFNRMVAAGQLP